MAYHVGDEVDSDNDIDDKKDGRGSLSIVCLHHHIWVARSRNGQIDQWREWWVINTLIPRHYYLPPQGRVWAGSSAYIRKGNQRLWREKIPGQYLVGLELITSHINYSQVLQPLCHWPLYTYVSTQIVFSLSSRDYAWKRGRQEGKQVE